MFYRHFKGDLYNFIAEAINAHNNEKMVVYESMEDGLIYVESYEEFYGTVLVDGREVQRFENLEKKSLDEWESMKNGSI